MNIWPNKDSEEHDNILDRSVDCFVSFTFMESEYFIRSLREFLEEKENYVDQRRLVSTILDIARIKKLSKDEALTIIRHAADYYMKEMICRHIFNIKFRDLHPKATSPFVDIVFYVEKKIMDNVLDKMGIK